MFWFTVLRRYSKPGWLNRLTDEGARTWAASGVLTAAGRSLAARHTAPTGFWTSTAHHQDRPKSPASSDNKKKRDEGSDGGQEEVVPLRRAQQSEGTVSTPAPRWMAEPGAVHRSYGCEGGMIS